MCQHSMSVRETESEMDSFHFWALPLVMSKYLLVTQGWSHTPSTQPSAIYMIHTTLKQEIYNYHSSEVNTHTGRYSSVVVANMYSALSC